MSQLFPKILFALMPVVMLAAGGMLAIFRTARGSFKSIVLHFAAGVVFSVVAVELLPDMIRLHDTFMLVLGYMAGITCMLIVKKFTSSLVDNRLNQSVPNSLPWAALAAFAIDLEIDGILLGVGYAAGRKEGTLLSLALAVECLSLGVAIVTSVYQETVSRTTLFLIIFGSCIVFLIGEWIGSFLLQNAPDRMMEFILSFGAASLMYLVTEELLVEAHEERDSPLFTGLFFVGFLIFLILGLVI